MKQYHVGIIGAGVISRVYLADIQSFYQDIKVIACGDIDIERARQLADEFGIETYCSTEELLANPDVEIVINLTPPQFHMEISRKILESGKHLFSEKPFAPTAKEAQELIDLANEKGVRVSGAPDTFLGSGLQSVRYYLDAGMIGTPFFVTMNMTTFGVETWHPNPYPYYKQGAGPLYDMAPYYLSSLVALLGPIESIASFSTSGLDKRHVYTGPTKGAEITPEVPTHYTGILRLKSGVVVNFNISFDIYKSNLPMFEIYGDGGTLTYPNPNFGGGTPRIYRKEQYLDPIYNNSEDAAERKEQFRELPELFPRAKDYSRGIGVLDLASAVEHDREARANGAFLRHITEAIEGMLDAAEHGTVYRMQTSCKRPAPLEVGGALGQMEPSSNHQ